VTKRRYASIAVTGAALVCCCLLLSCWITSRVREAAASRNVSSLMLVPHRAAAGGKTGGSRTGTATLAVAAPLAWIARRVEAVLRAHGLRPAAATAGAPVVCDLAVSEKSPHAKTA
jgi:hypothetical protein